MLNTIECRNGINNNKHMEQACEKSLCACKENILAISN
jgi:hypothetical protein